MLRESDDGIPGLPTAHPPANFEEHGIERAYSFGAHIVARSVPQLTPHRTCWGSSSLAGATTRRLSNARSILHPVPHPVPHLLWLVLAGGRDHARVVKRQVGSGAAVGELARCNEAVEGVVDLCRAHAHNL